MIRTESERIDTLCADFRSQFEREIIVVGSDILVSELKERYVLGHLRRLQLIDTQSLMQTAYSQTSEGINDGAKKYFELQAKAGLSGFRSVIEMMDAVDKEVMIRERVLADLAQR